MGAYLFRPERTRPRTIVFIEGNISAGKSTLIEGLKAAGYPVWEENLTTLSTDFTDSNGKTLLELFYADMPRYAFELQLASLSSRWKIIKEALEADAADVVFVERSLLTDRFTFALHLYEKGFLTYVQWKLYMALLCDRLDDAATVFDTVRIKTLYLQTQPEICMTRTSLRNRPGEVDGISTEYLQGLHDKLETWLVNDDTHIIDASQDPDAVLQDCMEAIS